jgi:hypothetical protein
LVGRAALAIVVALCVTAMVGRQPMKVTAAAAAVPPPLTRLGFYPGYASVTGLRTVEKWLGRNATHVVQFGDQDSTQFTGSVWGQVADTDAMQTISGRMTLVESIPLAFGNNLDADTPEGQALARSYLTATVNGANDANYKIAANYLVAGGYPDAILRLGWEFDGGWYPWSSEGNEALWITAYRHVADLFRAISPQFRLDWNGTKASLQSATDAYPGDDYVDIVGLDVYDKGIPVAWNSVTKSWSNPAAAWSWTKSNLVFQRDFAIAHGKPVSYPEWALTGATTTVTSAVGGDDPTFVQGMSDWMTGLPASGGGSLAYHSYFNANAKDGHHQIDSTYFPKAQALYKADFGVAADTSVALTASSATSVFGQPVTLTARATSATTAATSLTGTMNFVSGTMLLGSATVANGVATLTTTKVAIGDRNLVAKYARGTGIPLLLSPTLVHHVDKASTALTVTSSAPVSAVFGQKVTIVAAVKAVAPGAGAVAGTVTLTDTATNVVMSHGLQYGKTSFIVAGLGVGTHPFAVRYAGATNFAPTSIGLTQVVVQATSRTVLTTAPSIVVSGSPATLNATVTCKLPCTAVATGSVTFTEGATVIGGPIALNTTGVASFTTSSLTKGSHTLTATYSGSSGIAPSSLTLTKTVT